MPFLIGLAVLTFGAGGAIGAIGALAVGIGVNALEKALAPHPDLGGSQVSFSANKSAGVPYLIGRTGTGGNIVFIDTSNDGHNKWIHYFVVFSTGPVDSFVGFTANQTAISFSAGAATTSPYNGKMWLTTQLGAQPESAALTAPGGTGTVPEWTASHKLSGLAAARWILQSDQKTYPAGPPQPLWVWKGAKVYDPRLDSTYPGGSGSQRSNDYTTWAWSENPYLHGLTWCIGQTSNGIRTVGLGAPIASIDVAAFVAGANIADTNSWKCGGVVTSQDSKWDVLTAMLQAGGGTPVRQGNTISCIVNTPLVSVATLTGADVVGEAQITGSQPRRSRINSVTPTYRSETHNWEQVAADPVTISAYVSADGQKRSKAITYALVQNATQASQLAYYEIANQREFSPVVLPLKARWNGIKPGDAITLNENELGMTSQKLLVLTRQRDPATGLPTITCRSETDAKHAAALALSGNPPPTPSLSAVDLVNVPAPGAGVWTVAGVTLTDGNGSQTSALQVTGAIDNPNASGIVIEYAEAGSGTWIQWPMLPTSTTLVNITAVKPNTSYDVRVSYVQRNNISATRTATSSPATTGVGATYNQNVTINTTDTGSYSWTSPTGYQDAFTISMGVLKTGGFFILSVKASFISNSSSGNLNWQLVLRNTSGGGDAQVIASGSSGAVGTTGGLHVITDRVLLTQSYSPNTSATSAAKDLVFQWKDGGGTSASLGTFGTGGGNTVITGSFVA